MFRNCESLTSLDLSNFNTLSVTSMSSMFEGCKNLETIEFGINFDTSWVKSMSYLFYGCEKLKQIDIGNFDTGLARNMSHMFDSCISLTSLDFNEKIFDTSENIDFSYMFNNCTNLTSLDISFFKTNNAKDMSFMFSNCSSITNISLKFDTTSVNTMESMFDSCKDLKYLDLTSFNTQRCIKFSNMFANTENMTVLVNSLYCDNMIDEIQEYVNLVIIND